jgi:hypothetical protein
MNWVPPITIARIVLLHVSRSGVILDSGMRDEACAAHPPQRIFESLALRKVVEAVQIAIRTYENAQYSAGGHNLDGIAG